MILTCTLKYIDILEERLFESACTTCSSHEDTRLSDDKVAMTMLQNLTRTSVVRSLLI